MKGGIYPIGSVVRLLSGGYGHHGDTCPNGDVVCLLLGGCGHHQGRHLPY